MLRRAVTEQGIDTSNLIMDQSVPTTLVFVHTASDLQSTRIFHFGSLSMTHEGIESVTKMAVEIANEGDALISFDPNLRPPLWNWNAVSFGMYFYTR